MSEPFLAEVRMVGFNFAPRGWAFCDGQILPINQNQSLFSLLGTTYGGDGRTSFGLPELRGRTPVHVGNGHALGEKAGEDQHTFSLSEIPQHTHVPQGANVPGDQPNPAGSVPATAPDNVYGARSDTVTMNAGMVANAGIGQSHENMMPFLAISFVIALQGLFPSRN